MATSFRGKALDRPALILSNIQLSNDRGERVDGIEGLVDTGADRSAVPAWIAKRLKLRQVGTKIVVGYDGRASERPIVHCRVFVNGLFVPLVPVKLEHVIADPEQTQDKPLDERAILLGRDFLHDLPNGVLFADFARKKWTVRQSSRLRRLLTQFVA